MEFINDDIRTEKMSRDRKACMEITNQINHQIVSKNLKKIKKTDLDRLNNKMIEFINQEDIDDIEIEYILRKFVRFIND